jgi:hypothetical protein
MRFAYADPPYPGLAHYYPERQEVDHASLLDRLTTEFPDGWALSTSSRALRAVLALCPPDVRICAWFKGPRPTKSRRAVMSWEPVLVHRGRELSTASPQVLRDALIAQGRFRAYPGALVGMKPPAFAEWLFAQLGAAPGDELVDLFPGSGAVRRAWIRYTSPQYSNDASAAAPRDASSPAESDGSTGCRSDASPRGAHDASPSDPADASRRAAAANDT